LTSALHGGHWSASRPGRFTPQGRSPWYPADRRLGGSQSQSGHGVKGEKFPVSAGNRTPTIRSFSS